MLGEFDGGKGLQIIGVHRLKVVAKIVEQCSRLITVAVPNQLQVRIYENGPEEF